MSTDQVYQSFCQEKVPQGETRLRNKQLSTIIESELVTDILKPLKLKGYVGVIHLDWKRFTTKYVKDAWKLRHEKLSNLYEIFLQIQEVAFIVTVLTPKDCRIHKRKTSDGEHSIEELRKSVEYGMPKIEFIIYFKTLNGKEKDYREYNENNYNFEPL